MVTQRRWVKADGERAAEAAAEFKRDGWARGLAAGSFWNGEL